MSLHNRKFKALIIDCDGTLVLNKMGPLPTKAVADAIKKASGKLHIGIATQRPLFYARPILEHLELSGPSIISGGAQVIDNKTFKVLYEELIDKKDLLEVIKIIKEFKKKNNFKFYIQDNKGGEDKEWTEDYIPKRPVEAGVFGLELEVADNLKDKLSTINNLAVHKVASWEEGKYGIALTAALATKQYGIFEVAKILGIKTHEIMGIGDGYNDFPLLMACGFKVAMGNAVPDLKEIADYVAPTVEEDGVASVINKFIL